MSNITIICGAIFSGTSMIAKLCLDNGAWLGQTAHGDSTDYDIYENARFRQLCRNAIAIDNDLKGQNLASLFSLFFNRLPKNHKIILKYPKSFYLLRFFKDSLTLDFKVVYVIRNPYTRAMSYQRKTNIPNFAVALQEWNEAYLYLTQQTIDLDVYPLLYERFFVEPLLETKKLFSFIGLQPDIIDISAIDTSKKHF